MSTKRDGTLETREDALQVVARYAVFHPAPGERYKVQQEPDGTWVALWKENDKQGRWAKLDALHCRTACGGTLWHLYDEDDVKDFGYVRNTDPNLTPGSGLPKPHMTSVFGGRAIDKRD